MSVKTNCWTQAIKTHDEKKQSSPHMKLKASFRKVKQLKRVSVLFDLFAVQPVRSQNHVWLRNANKMKSLC